MGFTYPVNLDLVGRPCVVVGGGKIAEEKIKGLLEAGAEVRVVAPALTDTLEKLRDQGHIDVTRRDYSRGDLNGAWLAIAATDDTITNASVFDEAEQLKVLLCSVDDIDHCHFAAPATVRRGDFLVTISTAGKAPALAKRLRRELEARFGPDWGALVDMLSEARAEALARGGRECGFEEWSRRWAKALDQDLLTLVSEGDSERAKDRVVKVLVGEDDTEPQAPGKVWIVGAGPGDPELLTMRGRRALDAADVVIHDRLVHHNLVSGRPAIYAGKQAGNHHMSQQEVNSLLVRLARKGKSVVRLKGGDPFVFGRGAEEAEALAAAGIPFEVVPGPTSALATLAAAGIPATDRRVASSVAIVTGHRSGDQAVKLRELAGAADTIVVLMGLAGISFSAAELIAGGRAPATPAAIIENGTLPEQRVIVTTLAELPAAAAEAAVQSPATIVVGEVVGLRERLEQVSNGSLQEERVASTL